MDFDVEEVESRNISSTSEEVTHVEKVKVSPFGNLMGGSTSKSGIPNINKDNNMQVGHFGSEDSYPYDIASSNEESFKSSAKSNSVDWHSVKSSGLGDLENDTFPSRKAQRKELLSHVPTETVVMKYGYVGLSPEIVVLYHT